MAKQNKKSRSKQRKFKDEKKKLQRRKLQAVTFVPAKQSQRWTDAVAILTPDAIETQYDPDYVAFAVSRSLDAADNLDNLWLRIAAALKLRLFVVKEIDRSGVLREFDSQAFSQTVEENDWDHEYGLRYEADKFLCYLLYGNHPRFREMFGYVLLPAIKSERTTDISGMEYSQWVSKEVSKELAEKLVSFDLAEVE